jgi:hypothetical protein
MPSGGRPRMSSVAKRERRILLPLTSAQARFLWWLLKGMLDAEALRPGLRAQMHRIIKSLEERWHEVVR